MDTITELSVRKTTHQDVPAVMEIIRLAKEDIRASGSDQWQNGKPNAQMIHADVDAGKGYVLVNGQGQILGTAFISCEDEPTYHILHGGAWRSQEPYTVVHRIAVDRSVRGKGLAWELILYAIHCSQEQNIHWLRIDTHPVNIPMQHFLARHGFSQRGIIDVEDGIRLAYDFAVPAPAASFSVLNDD